MSSNPTDPEDLLVDHVRRALAAQERGDPVDLDRLCAGHPHLRVAVGEALGLSRGLATAGRSLAQPDASLGRVLDRRYRLEERLGRGAMGAVFAARDLELDREVAVKVFDTIGVAKAGDRERFAREARALAALCHPHVVTIFDRGHCDDGTRYLVMERLRGQSLAVVLRELAAAPAGLAGLDFAARLAAVLGVMPRHREGTWLRSGVRWCAQVARGLQAAHAVGLLHRDVKPSNVLVTRSGDAVLLDFGIAHKAGDPELTARNATLGTPWYMAPEQADRRGRTPAATIDVYGLCATLYHLVTGRPPYEGDALQVLAAIQRGDPPPLRHVRRDLPRDLVAIIEHGMERDPARRYQESAALAADLEAFLEHRPVVARPIGRVGRAWRTARRSPARSLAVTAGALVVVLLALVWPLWHGHVRQARAAERAELFVRLPALLAVEGQPSQRLLEPLGERAELLATLDRLLELDPADLPHRLWRALLRLDHGDHAGTAADLAALAGAGGSPYLAAVAERYARARRDQNGTEAVDLADLPAPQGDFDWFVAGLHELRNRHVPGFAPRALQALDRVAERYLPARDLRVIALLSVAESTKDRELFQKAADETAWLEGRYGRPTARVLALRGAALLGLRRYPEALAALQEADRLRPGRHGPLINIGTALRRLGRIDEAIGCFERACAVRPLFWNSRYMLALAQKDRGDFDQALASCAALEHVTQVPELMWRRPELRATILLQRALRTGGEDEDLARSRRDAREARVLFQQAAGHTQGGLAEVLALRAGIAGAVGAGNTSGSVAGYLRLLAADPDDAYQIFNLSTLLLDAPLDAEAVAMLRHWLRRLATALLPDDRTLARQERAARELESATSRPR